MQIAREEGLFGPHLQLFAAIGRVHPQVLGKTLPLNGAGVCGAALADLGLPLPLLRGFALLARTAGLIGQLAEELRHPVANEIFLSVDLHNRSVAARPVDLGDLMRAALIETPGSPAVPGERPEPTRGEGEVLVAVSAAPIVPLDRLCARGTSYFGVPSTPYVPGVQGVGPRAGRAGRPAEGHPGLVRDDARACSPATAACGRSPRSPRTTSSRCRRARTRSWSPRSGSRPSRPGWR